ncbi:MAG: hypothetical protein ACLFPV_05355 [Spirochaetaceae bacterium]
MSIKGYRMWALSMVVGAFIAFLTGCGGAGGGGEVSGGSTIALPQDSFRHLVLTDEKSTMDGDFMVMVHLVGGSLTSEEAIDLVAEGYLTGSMSDTTYIRMGIYDGDPTTPLKPGVYPVRLAPQGNDVASVFLATGVSYDFENNILESVDLDAATPGEIGFGTDYVTTQTIVGGTIAVGEVGSEYVFDIELNTESGDKITAGFSGSVTGITRDYDCGAISPDTNAVFLYYGTKAWVSDMGGSRHHIDHLVEPFLDDGLSGTSDFKTLGFVSMTGDAIADFPSNHCVPSDVPVIGVIRDTGNSTYQLADNWEDFTDGTIDTTIGTALGTQDHVYFWTGSNNDGTASGYDCDNWSRDYGIGAGISNRSKTTSNWLDGVSNANCSAGYALLGLAFCLDNCIVE